MKVPFKDAGIVCCCGRERGCSAEILSGWVLVECSRRRQDVRRKGNLQYGTTGTGLQDHNTHYFLTRRHDTGQ